jgi:gas vesicle protein
MAEKGTAKKLAIGSAIAGIAGYITGVLTAPKSGKETREDITDAAWDVKDSLENQLRDLSDELKDLLDQTKNKTVALSSHAREDFNESIVKAKDAQNKAASVLKAAKAGEASDPELNKAVKQARQAIKNLGKYMKSDKTEAPPKRGGKKA